MNFPQRPIRRRHFISDLILASAAIKFIALGALLVDYWSENGRELEFFGTVLDEANMPLKASSMAPGSVKSAVNGGNKILVIRDGDGMRALSKACTHKSCTVKWDQENNMIRCPCHGSRYALTGEVLKGPAKKPLQKIDLKIENDLVSVVRGGAERIKS